MFSKFNIINYQLLVIIINNLIYFLKNLNHVYQVYNHIFHKCIYLCFHQCTFTYNSTNEIMKIILCIKYYFIIFLFQLAIYCVHADHLTSNDAMSGMLLNNLFDVVNLLLHIFLLYQLYIIYALNILKCPTLLNSYICKCLIWFIYHLKICF